MVTIANIADFTLRPELGDYTNIVFIKTIIIGLEEALGEKTTEIALTSSGRKQGKILAQELDLVGKGVVLSVEEITQKIDQILGKQGTRLCIIDKIELGEDVYKVYTQETFCSAGEPEGSSRKCTYTLGLIQGLLEALLNHRLRGQQTGSILRGSTHDVLEYTIMT
jgi:predicted hydrocarbon binding protein